MNQSNEKRKALSDVSYTSNNTSSEYTKQCAKQIQNMLPVVSSPLKSETSVQIPRQLFLQNVHPLLAMYKHDLPSETMSYSSFCDMLLLTKEPELLHCVLTNIHCNS